MKVSSGLGVIGALLVAALPFSSKALGQDQTAPALWPTADGVVYYGEVEAGGRAFIERPEDQIRTITSTTAPPVNALLTPAFISSIQSQKQSRAKFEEYGNIKPGFVFDHVNLGAVTKDGLYFTDFYAKNIGNNDQTYRLELGETGRQYLTLKWDQTPHLFSTTAQSIFGGTPTNLTTNVDLSPGSPSGCNGGTAATAAACATAITNNLQTINLGIRRDKGTAEYRYLFTDEVELNVAYSHERRTGNQETGIIMGGGTGSPSAQVPMPIADTTQDARASLQYAGTSFWGKKLTANIQYSASIFQNDYDSFTVQNPFIANALAPGGVTPGSMARYSLYPDNAANSITATIGADLAGKSRYMGTFSYTTMQQNDPFMPQTIATGLAGVAVPPRGSLNGRVDTLLSNNVVTAQITPDLKGKLTYRYYSYDNQTPPLTLANFVIGDTTVATAAQSYAPHTTQFSSYVKQNGGADLNWRASSWLTTGVALGWERFQRDQANVNVTNEYSGKIFADVKPSDQITVRSSYQYSERRYENYDYTRFVWALITSQPSAIGPGGLQINDLMRTYNLANRDRQKANVYLDIDVGTGLVVTPTFGLRYDKYPIDPMMPWTTVVAGPVFTTTSVAGANQLGLREDNSWNAGLEVSVRLAPSITLMGSYVHEDFDRTFFWNSNLAFTGANSNHSQVNVKDFVDTFTAAVNFELKPKVLDLKFAYIYALATETGAGASCLVTGGPILGTCNPAAGNAVALSNLIPDVRSNFQRFETILKYQFEQEQTRQFGWMGQAYIKLRYVFEQNRVSNWQNDSMMPYMFAVASAANKVYLAGDNPNYRAQAIVATLGFTW